MNGIKIVTPVGVGLHSADFYLQKVNHAEPAGRAVRVGAGPCLIGLNLGAGLRPLSLVSGPAFDLDMTWPGNRPNPF